LVPKLRTLVGTHNYSVAWHYFVIRPRILWSCPNLESALTHW